MSDDKNFSLQGEMRKRKTQQLQQVIEAQQIERAVGAAQTPKRATQTARAVTVEPGLPEVNSAARQTQQAPQIRLSLIDRWQSLPVIRRRQLIISVTTLL